jgi:hypothetical protein
MHSVIARDFRFLFMAVSIFIPAGAALAEPIESQKIITALTGDFNGDKAQDLVVIAETKPGAPHDMYFFLRDKEHNYLKQVDVVREQIDGEWNGYDRPGYSASDTEPELSLLPNGSILLRIPALLFGSERTDQTLTIAYRAGRFVVAGFAYDYVDYLGNATHDGEGRNASCDYNLLTGKGKSAKLDKQGNMVEKSVDVEPQVVAFKDWNFSDSLTACGNME